MSDGADAVAAGPDLPGLEAMRRIVVKIGSALLVDEASGAIRHDWLQALGDDVAALKARGAEVVLVSSGAISVGRRCLGLRRRTIRLEEKQAAAATGQLRLAHAYQDTLSRHDITVAQVLLTLDDTEARRRHLNARATITTLLRLGVVPVINENDTVATTEIRFGDNDRLAARVAAMIDAEALVLLSDIDGLYSSDPKRDAWARFIPRVDDVTAEIEAMAGEPPPGYSSGGMVTKLAAARIAISAGCHMAIAQGWSRHPLARMQEGGRCTWFVAEEEPRTARKRWIAGGLNPAGALTVDAGALRALKAGKSLLPAGVGRIDGSFQRGDLVIVRAPDSREVARGIVAYGAREAQRIQGRKSKDIEAILGYRGREELIHRDDLVLTEERTGR